MSSGSLLFPDEAATPQPSKSRSWLQRPQSQKVRPQDSSRTLSRTREIRRRTPSYPMMVMSVPTLMELDRVLPHQEMLKRGLVVPYNDETMAARVIFISVGLQTHPASPASAARSNPRDSSDPRHAVPTICPILPRAFFLPLTPLLLSGFSSMPSVLALLRITLRPSPCSINGRATPMPMPLAFSCAPCRLCWTACGAATSPRSR